MLPTKSQTYQLESDAERLLQNISRRIARVESADDLALKRIHRRLLERSEDARVVSYTHGNPPNNVDSIHSRIAMK